MDTYEKEYKSLVAKVKKAHLFAQTDSTKNVLEDILPELRESEDKSERIRKELIQFLNDIKDISESGRISWAVRKDDAEMCNNFITYLKKQKDFAADEYWRGFKNGRDEVIENPDAFNLQEKQKELPFVKDVMLGYPGLYFYDGERMHFRGPAMEEKQKEPKELPLMGGNADLYFDEWNQQKQNPTKRQCFEEGMRYAQRLQKEQKPAEWSEEDEFFRQQLIIYCENCVQDTLAIKCVDWLKSLRPHWKPSEEQIGALNYAYCELFKRKDVGHNILGPLQKLLDDLKKLM